MAITKYASNKNLDYLLGKISFTPPTTYYLALSTTPISSSGSNITEPTGGSTVGYTRVSITNDKTNFNYASNGCLVNAQTFTYSQSSGSWGTISDVALMDAATSGSAWMYFTLDTPKIIQSSTTVFFSGSAITFSEV